MRTALAALLTLILALSPRDAHAYLDPGTGSYIFQAVAAAIIGAGFVVRSFWSRIRGGLGRLFGQRRDAGPTR
jgi:hypothetical protein